MKRDFFLFILLVIACVAISLCSYFEVFGILMDLMFIGLAVIYVCVPMYRVYHCRKECGIQPAFFWSIYSVWFYYGIFLVAGIISDHSIADEQIAKEILVRVASLPMAMLFGAFFGSWVRVAMVARVDDDNSQ